MCGCGVQNTHVGFCEDSTVHVYIESLIHLWNYRRPISTTRRIGQHEFIRSFSESHGDVRRRAIHDKTEIRGEVSLSNLYDGIFDRGVHRIECRDRAVHIQITIHH